jgi:hypothetical protein
MLCSHAPIAATSPCVGRATALLRGSGVAGPGIGPVITSGSAVVGSGRAGRLSSGPARGAARGR